MNIADLRGRTTIRVEEAATLFEGMGRTAAYDAVRRGELPAVRLGRRLFVPVPRLLDLLGAHVELDGALRDDAPASADLRRGSVPTEAGTETESYHAGKHERHLT